ncbi:MAG: amidohydrolase [Spirochaetes bacterium]|nr:MAG: amidohydrolase [Spirochaetota bacterium]
MSDVFRTMLRGVGITGGAGEELAEWSARTTLDTMDRCGISASVLSYTISGIVIEDLQFFRRLSRASNEYLAELIQKYPGRFGGFALLPLPDIDATLKEIEYAMDVLKLDGVGMHSNMGGIYPGDSRFDPVFDELNRRKAVIHLHPTDIPGNHELRPQWPPYIVEFMFETTRAVSNLIFSGAMERYPDLSIILSHAGGAAPYLALRLWTGEFTIDGLQGRAPKGVLDYLGRFYYDTAMASSPVTFGALLKAVDTGRVLFGSDYPYMPDIAIAGYMDEINKYPDFSAQTRNNIYGDTALGLFPRLQKTPNAGGGIS